MIKYTHQVHARSRSLKIKIEPTGEVIVVTPRFVPRLIIDKFVSSHTEWIQRTLAKLKQRLTTSSADTLLLFGKEYQKKITTDHDQPLGVTIDGQSVVINLVASKSGTVSATKADEYVERFIKQTAEKYLIPRTHQLAKLMNTTFRGISLRQQKTRWGSCSSEGNLNFNWRLVHYPTSIIDYVIIHELAHRHHMNHSAAFWNVVKKYDPAFQQHRGWLRRHGLTLG